MRCPVGALRTPHNPQSPHRPSAITTTHLVNDDCFPQRRPSNHPIEGHTPIHEAAAGSVRSEHRNVDIRIPLARPRESPTGPNVPCERRIDPAEPPPPTSPRRQPRRSATAKQVRASGCMRRSFRTHRLCVSPAQSLPAEPPQIRPAERDRAGASLGSEHQSPSRTARKPLLPRASSASAGSIPRSPPSTQPQSSSGSLPTALLRLQFNRVSIRTSTCIVRSVSPL